MIPGSILSHPTDDHDDDFDIDWHDIGGEAGGARMNKEPFDADDLPGYDDEDNEGRFNWDDDIDAPIAPNDWDDENDPAFAELNPDFVRRPSQDEPRRPRGRLAGFAY